MKTMDDDTLAKAPHSSSQRWQNASWYAALSLPERLASLHTGANELPCDTLTIEKALQRLQKWKTQPPFDQGTLFAERLADDAMTEDDLLALLAEPLAAVQACYLSNASIPGWLRTLEDAFEGDSAGEEELPLQETTAPFARSLAAISPLIKRSLDQLYVGVQQLCRQYQLLPFDAQRIVQVWFTLLPERLLSQLSKTFVLEMHVARIQHRLQGDTPAERFADFVRQLSQEEKILPLLEEYPVLARQCTLTLDQWASYGLDFLAHLCADWQNIRATFTPEDDPGPLTTIQGGLSDPHREGRSVLKLQFRSGFQLLYKPKSLAIDVHFQELLTWLNKRGAQPAFHTIKILDRGRYGWSEFVYAHGCSCKEEVVRFYERQGNYLALLYALNATDIHVENLIASGEHPILVDLEALFHSQINGNDPTQPYQLSLIAMDRSVFRIGLLPHRIWSSEDTSGVDLSGMGGEAGQVTPRPLPRWEDAGTDQMRLVRQRAEIAVKQNRPKLNNRDVNILDYGDSIIAGFMRMYQLLTERRDELLAEMLPRFAHDEVRLLVRPSQRYATLLAESFHPDLLRDALERDRFFDQLWSEAALKPYFSRIISAERCDLQQGDIPVFTTYPDSCSIFTSHDEELRNFFDEPGLKLVEQRLRDLDEQDMARQRWIIEASLATLLMGPERMAGKALSVGTAQVPATHERILASACAVGERLASLAVHNEYGASWLGVSIVNELAWRLQPADIDLYGGTSGIALFLSYLGALTGETRYTKLATLALASVRSQVEQQKKYLKWATCGVFDGLGSAIYLYTHLSVLWKQPALLEEALALVELLPALINKDERLDIISGSAGCIMNLLGLYSVHPSPDILDVALQCGDRLIATAQPMQNGVAWTTVKHEKPLGGFAHGTAGIAVSLLKLAAISGQERYYRMAQDALKYDRSLFVPDRQNWDDLRTYPSALVEAGHKNETATQRKVRQASMVAWCHGAAGIGLSRLEALNVLDDAIIRREIDVALETITTTGLTDNHSLCHGALGNIDIMLTATQILADRCYDAALADMTAMALESIAIDGWVTGVPSGIETPGLMSGLAGIGYALLRLAEPRRVPSVLSISPPLTDAD